MRVYKKPTWIAHACIAGILIAFCLGILVGCASPSTPPRGGDPKTPEVAQVEACTFHSRIDQREAKRAGSKKNCTKVSDIEMRQMLEDMRRQMSQVQRMKGIK